MNAILRSILAWFGRRPQPEHLRRGVLGEAAARRFLERAGLKFIAGNVRGGGGEIDLICRDGDCLVFVEVKTRSNEDWTRPAAAVNAAKRAKVSGAAQNYLSRLRNPEVKFRFDIVEVLLSDGEVREVRHLPNAFPLTRRKPKRWG